MNSFAPPLVRPDIVYRILGAEDAEAYRDIRLESLMGNDRRFFTANPQQEIARTLEDWRKVCAETYDHVIVGAFYKEVLVGVMSATRFEKDWTGLTIYYGAEYVRPAFRHIGIARSILAIRDGWSINNDCERAVFTIRTDNEWLGKQMRHGAKIKEELRMTFADGATAPIYMLERKLFDTDRYKRSAVA